MKVTSSYKTEQKVEKLIKNRAGILRFDISEEKVGNLLYYELVILPPQNIPKQKTPTPRQLKKNPQFDIPFDIFGEVAAFLAIDELTKLFSCSKSAKNWYQEHSDQIDWPSVHRNTARKFLLDPDECIHEENLYAINFLIPEEAFGKMIHQYGTILTTTSCTAFVLTWLPQLNQSKKLCPFILNKSDESEEFIERLVELWGPFAIHFNILTSASENPESVPIIDSFDSFLSVSFTPLETYHPTLKRLHAKLEEQGKH